MYKIIAYLNFLFSSTNQHGVHSPFVYDYVTKCLYARQKFKVSKAENVLFKSMGYFNVKNIWISSGSKPLQKKIQAEHPSIQINHGPYDLIFIDAPHLEESFNFLFENIHNNSMLLIGSIYKNKPCTKLWQMVKDHEKARVTIDMYHCGAVFFRKEQASEHFRIRI
ncbi:hypothetical protein ACEZ3G_00365 [Maribacter algicola]|uniref:Uncharacterized protein n=1 Tax=Meishania litoralis TaxID=3434685 RepID=A0ACC7LFK0_9FLAO